MDGGNGTEAGSGTEAESGIEGESGTEGGRGTEEYERRKGRGGKRQAVGQGVRRGRAVGRIHQARPREQATATGMAIIRRYK